MSARPKDVLAFWTMTAGLMILALSSVFMFSGLDPFHTHYYLFAWWSFILAAEAWLHLSNGRSLLFGAPARFLGLCAFSVILWLFFEALNFRLQNWHYINLPRSLSLRWAGYVASFATVLPALSVVRRILELLGLPASLRVPALPNPATTSRVPVLIGALFLILPLIWPLYFFPLVWGAFILLLEPYVLRHGRHSLLWEWRQGSALTLVRLLAAGAVCGFLWEFWNAWAGAKWVYTVPFVPGPKIFEMPWAGFLGFPPFAVQCFVATEAAGLFWSRRGPAERLAVAVLCVVFAVLVMVGIDNFTMLSLVE